MNLAEQLYQINQLREAAKDQEAKGEKPAVSSSTFNLMEKMTRNVHGDYSMGRTAIQEALTSTDAIKMIPKVIEGQLREAAEPEYLGTRFMQTVHVEGGSSTVYVIPVVGELTATEVGEGTRYNEDYVDFNTIENSALEIRVKKVGLKVSITEEAIQDSSWDILGINVRKMGKAMARYKEEWIFNTFSDHGHVIFDNNLRSQFEEAGTTGRDASGNFNDTLSVEDFLDLVLALMGNGFVPSDVIMHPLTWVIFARNSMIGNGLSYGALGGNAVHPNGGIQGTPAAFGLANSGDGQKMIMRPEQVQNRLPMPLTVNFSPFVHFDKVNKRFDMYCIDKNEVGVIVQKEGLSSENWTDPEKDIRALKCKERYGVGVLNGGRGITVVRNIAVAPSYPTPPVVTVHTTP
jgi:hypothetical protein